MNGMNLFGNLNNRLKNDRRWATIDGWGRAFNAVKMIISKNILTVYSCICNLIANVGRMKRKIIDRENAVRPNGNGQINFAARII